MHAGRVFFLDRATSFWFTSGVPSSGLHCVVRVQCPFDPFWPAMAKRRYEHFSARGRSPWTALRACNECGSRFFFKSDFISFDLRGNLFTGFIALCACNAHLTPFGLQWRSCAMSILARAATAPGLHCARAVNAATVAHGGHYPVFPTPITRPRPELKWQHEMWAFQRPVSRQATPSRQRAAALMPPGSLGPTPPANRRGRSVSSWGAAEPKGASL